MAKSDMDDEETPHPRRRLLALGIRLSDRMDELDLSGAEVARQVGISARQFNYYVKGERSPDLITANKIAAVLRISLDDLVNTKGFLRSRDDRTHAALRRFDENCTDLEAADIGLLAEFAEFMAWRRREEAKAGAYFGERIPPAFERLMRVHHLLIPAVLKRFAATRLETVVLAGDDEKLWVLISLGFDTHADRGAISNEIIIMATQRLGLSKEEVRSLSPERKVIMVEVCLGPDPGQQKPAEPKKKVRHRARGLPSLSIRSR
jgi:transcriptional regulator with XRE-family HTH domain